MLIIYGQVSSLVRPSCEDGRDFIRSSVARVLDNPFPPAAIPISKTKQLRAQKLAKQEGQPDKPKDVPMEPAGPPRQRITQYVMNLPDSAITFLGAFRGLLSPANTGGRDSRSSGRRRGVELLPLRWRRGEEDMVLLAQGSVSAWLQRLSSLSVAVVRVE